MKMKAKSFQAVLEKAGNPLQWVIVRIPFDAAKFWGTRARIRIKGTINGFAFRTSLFPSRDGGHILLVNKQMQKGASVRAGQSAEFTLELDLEQRVALMAPELKMLLKSDKHLSRWYTTLNYSTRKAIGDWVLQPKSAAARTRRAEQIAERLMLTMEAEQELPPLLRVAFARNPKAAAEWNKMSLSRRRGHLLGIFGYRSPESRARRIDKALQDEERLADSER
jgi:uncharacterized protein YdeI (YjbR/CyaY-like superfamily)